MYKIYYTQEHLNDFSWEKTKEFSSPARSTFHNFPLSVHIVFVSPLLYAKHFQLPSQFPPVLRLSGRPELS